MAKTNKKTALRKIVKKHWNDAVKLSHMIHGYAEPAFQEVKSANAIEDYLKTRGFRVTRPFKNIPTAIHATRGKGGPVIGILGEYDALPNCGEIPGQWGHGCGHDLFGAASALGAVSAAEYLESIGAKGRIVFYGCPAEENLGGKVFMARDGAFKDLDAAITWHPADSTGVNHYSGTSLDSVIYEFFGKTAHGASAHEGRSALDAAIITDVAVNYLREHVPDNIRIHMAIRDGGDVPNVVPEYAKSWYYVRAKDRVQVDDIRKRVDKCAKGAAIATETTVKIKRLVALYERLPNDGMSDAIIENLKQFGTPKPDKNDLKRLRKLGLKAEFNTDVSLDYGSQGSGSSDEQNVSWLVPLGRFNVACHAKNTPGHHRSLSAQMVFPFAGKAIRHAGLIFAGTASDLCLDKKLLSRIKAEFKKKTKGFTYDPLIGKNQKVPVISPG